jgi:hypothetical protein
MYAAALPADTFCKLTDPRADEQQERKHCADIHQYGSHEKVLLCHLSTSFQASKKHPFPDAA